MNIQGQNLAVVRTGYPVPSVLRSGTASYASSPRVATMRMATAASRITFCTTRSAA